MAIPKFKVGQIVMYDRGKKRGIPLKLLGVVEQFDQIYYRVDRKNCLAEPMLRALPAEERGE